MSDATINDLVGGIYDAVIEPSRWPDAIEAIRVHYQFQLAMLGIMKLPKVVSLVQVACNVPQQYAEMLPSLTMHIPELWGGLAASARLPLEEPLLHSRMKGFETKDHNRYYLDWVRPQNIVDQVVILMANDRTINASLGMAVHADRKPVDDAELDELRILAPHLRRAVMISELLDASIETNATLESAFNAIGSGVVLVDKDLGILHANTAATGMLDREEPIRYRAGRLDITQPLVPGQLEDAVRLAAVNEAGIGRRGLSLPARRSDGSPVALHVMPLEQRNSRAGLPSRAAAAVFIADRNTDNTIGVDAVSALYGLTPSEAKVFGHVAAGRTSREIVLELGIASSTFKSHLLRVFDKTGRRNRADLVRLADQFSTPA
jgi:DNA-binding CsgD family transcriptional regulator/PAS domain-containing protein